MTGRIGEASATTTTAYCGRWGIRARDRRVSTIDAIEVVSCPDTSTTSAYRDRVGFNRERERTIVHTTGTAATTCKAEITTRPAATTGYLKVFSRATRGNNKRAGTSEGGDTVTARSAE